jgi:hypothetical protein
MLARDLARVFGSYLFLLLLTGAALAAKPPPAPVVTWEPTSLTLTVAQGVTTSAEVQMLVSKGLSNVQLVLSTELAPYLSVTPSSFAKLPVGQQTIKIGVLSGTGPGTFEGILEVFQGTKAVELALPVVLQVKEKLRPMSPLNDTGVTWGGEIPWGNFPTCTTTTTDIMAQDCQHGADVIYNDDSDGHGGFSFTKIGANGSALPASATAWDCVRDNVTGLMWEVKTDEGGLRDADWTYTSFDSTYNAGPEDFGVGSYSDNCGNTSKICTTAQYVADVNAVGLCGARDWRMPRVGELENIVHRDRFNPSIDTAWFPNTRFRKPSDIFYPIFYWSSSTIPAFFSYWGRCVWFNFGGSGMVLRTEGGYVRLVRDAE